MRQCAHLLPGRLHQIRMHTDRHVVERQHRTMRFLLGNRFTSKGVDSSWAPLPFSVRFLSVPSDVLVYQLLHEGLCPV
jgi:hypothetical protein